MKPENRIFFGEHGITATSANHLANLAKEDAAQDVEELGAANFITVLVKQVGTGNVPDVVDEGKDEAYVLNLQKRILHCAAMNSFCAWMREAIKAKEEEEEYWEMFSINDYARQVEGIEVPSKKYIPMPTEKDIISEMNIKEREEYLALEATAAAYGANIHPAGPINKARKALHKGLAKPCRMEDRVAGTFVYNNQASAKPETVDKVFEELQDQHRTIEQRLNSIKAKIKEELSRRKLQAIREQEAALDDFKVKYDALQTRHKAYVQERLEETQKLKIVIPDKLKSTYEYLNSKGKKPVEN